MFARESHTHLLDRSGVDAVELRLGSTDLLLRERHSETVAASLFSLKPVRCPVISEGEMVRIDTRSEMTLAIRDVFVEGPDGWVFSSPLPVSPAPDGNHSFLVKVLERPQRGDSLANLTLAVTLVAANAASETVLTLDKQGRAP